MSTRQSIYYDGPIHIWYELMDGRYWVSFDEEGTGNQYPLWSWAAMSLARLLEMTGRNERHDRAHKALCAQLNAARRDAIRTAIRHIEREACGAQWGERSIIALREIDKRWSE